MEQQSISSMVTASETWCVFCKNTAKRPNGFSQSVSQLMDKMERQHINCSIL